MFSFLQLYYIGNSAKSQIFISGFSKRIEKLISWDFVARDAVWGEHEFVDNSKHTPGIWQYAQKIDARAGDFCAKQKIEKTY